MPVHHEDQEVIASTMASTPGGIEQCADFGVAKKIAASFVGIGGLEALTLYISPVGHAPE